MTDVVTTIRSVKVFSFLRTPSDTAATPPLSRMAAHSEFAVEFPLKFNYHDYHFYNQPEQAGFRMTEIRMHGEMRTDYDCEVTGLPAERWGEAVFAVGDEELVVEVSVEKDVIVAIMAGDDAVWKGTLSGLKELLKSQIAKK